MSEPTFMNGKINYELMIRSYAEENEVSFREAMEFVASRNSLECAASLIGVELEGYRSEAAKAKLNQLGEFLDRKGYQVPPMWDTGAEQYIDPSPRSRYLPHDEHVVAYLELRKQGVPRYKAAEAVGVKRGSMTYWLRRHGLDTPEKESAAMGKVDKVKPFKQQSSETADKSSNNISSSENYPQPVDKPFETEITVTLKLEEHVIRAGFKALMDQAYDTACSKGWHDEPVLLPVQLALIHSEVSEALQADRKGEGADKVSEELADVMLRVMDTAATHKLDLVGALFAKMAKNRAREYRHGGLKY
ncbi:hypothetical protein GCM10025857_15090 [Alicyclobacillus contaminans]|uniref:hypothetical protein n=1 Tax=Alicyclobacillus contaminans TaxID=392016 RepID=UPI000401E647|nr:hypothetical protein [Alicyclobacillus contaminans]GMA50152.1 hypothetical protein GCM10025857_15090 [Alicyclobacillus contaminans]